MKKKSKKGLDYQNYRTLCKLPPEVINDYKKISNEVEESNKSEKHRKGFILPGIIGLIIVLLGGFVYTNRIIIKDIDIKTNLIEITKEEESSYKIFLGDEADFDAEVIYEGSIGKEPYAVVESSDSSILKVKNSTGGEKLIAEAIGTAVIKVNSGKVNKTYMVDVVDPVATIPNFEQFSNGLVTEVKPDEEKYKEYAFGTEENRYNYELSEFRIPFEEHPIDDVINQYVELLINQYGFEKISGSFGMWQLKYKETGSMIYLGLNDSIVSKYVGINILGEMRVEETDEKAEYLQLYCPDLFCSNIEYSIERWMPEGYDCKWYVNDLLNQKEKIQVKSSDNTVIKVDNEKQQIKAVGEGKAVITATCGSLTDSIEIIVLPVDKDYGSRLTLKNDVIDQNKKDEVTVESTMTFPSGAKSSQAAWAHGTIGQIFDFEILEYGNWNECSQKLKFRNTIDFSSNKKGDIAGIVLLVKCPDENYKWEENILDYKLIKIKRN